MFIKKLKCPACGGVAEMNLIKDEIIIQCKSRKDCNYRNKRKVYKKKSISV